MTESAAKPVVACCQCGKPYAVTKRTKKSCSFKCRRAFYMRRYRNGKAIRVKKECPICRREFMAKLGARPQVYDRAVCRKLARRRCFRTAA